MNLNEQEFIDVTSRFNSHFNNKWLIILDYIFPKSDEIEFNIFQVKKQLDSFINTWQDEFIEKGRRSNKIYPSGEYIRFKLTERFKEFIKSIKIREWSNYGLEDISFLKNGIEILAIITHENFIYLLMTDLQADILNNQDFNFELTIRD